LTLLEKLFYNKSMNAFEKLCRAGVYMHSEVTEVQLTRPLPALPGCGGAHPPKDLQDEPLAVRKKAASGIPVHFAVMPNGRRIALLKTALTTACERNCNYCAFRCGRDFERQTFSADEMARTFMQLYRARIVEGLFLSSAIAGGGVRTQDRLLACAEILRKRYAFKGYIHLKVMPGAQREQVLHAMRFADRVSVNLEGPTVTRLHTLAPQKQFAEELLAPLRWMEDIRAQMPAWQGWNGRWPSSTTQFVVGAVDETDVELLQITGFLHKQLRLARVYYSGFNPISDTPLENLPANNPLRQVRLYQSDFLLRDYGFDFEELEFSRGGYLLLEKDPKVIWADGSLRHAPLELNKADYHQLIRVPGIGPLNARKILEQRKIHALRSDADLRRLGVSILRAAPYILLNGKRPTQQLSFQF
jgi:predicted DNA-binding helix-hairpin-helix protein